MMHLRPVDVATLATVARPLLTGWGEAQHSLALGVISQIEAGERQPSWRYLAEDQQGEPVGVVLRTPPSPWIVALAPGTDPAALAAGLTTAHDEPARDLVGEARATAEVASYLAQGRAAAAHCIMRMPILTCEDLRPADGTPAGHVRPAATSDLDVVTGLQLAFQREALPQATVDPRQLRVRLVHRLTGRHGIRLFERPDGEVVSMAESGAPTPNGARIHAVYTPPEHRGHGYAAATVAAVTAEVLAARRFAFLNTDAANPTSNALYRRLGYEVVGEQAHWRLVPTSEG